MTSPDVLERESAVERIKRESDGLRAQLAEELDGDAARFSDDQANVLKFHGIYQQDDRDARQARRQAGLDKAFQFMVRSRIPGGALQAEQYLVHDDLASRFGNGTLRITTRQGLQLHGVLKGELRPALRALNDALVTTLAACGDVNRNVMACPAPPGDRAHEQIQTLAAAIAQRLTPRTRAYHEIWLEGERVAAIASDDDPDRTEADPLYGSTYLPRKFKIGIAHPDDNCVDVYTQDIGLVAHIEDGDVRGYTVLIGGGMGTTHGKSTTYPRLATPFCYAPPEQAPAIVETIVTIQRDFGDRSDRRHARMKYLVEERGVGWFKEQAESRLGFALERPRPIAWGEWEDHLGWQQQLDGRWSFGLFVENGRIKDGEHGRLRTALREIVTSLRLGVRLTGQQNVILTGISPSQRESVVASFATHGIDVERSSGGFERDAMACPALPTCGLALAEAERALPAVIRQIHQDAETLGLGAERIMIRMTGCPNGCARPYMGEIGFVGKSKGLYNVYLGGDRQNTRLNALFAENVRTEQLRECVRPVLAHWHAEREPGEALGDFCHRVGVETLRA